jgi:hypothetical protein
MFSVMGEMLLLFFVEEVCDPMPMFFTFDFLLGYYLCCWVRLQILHVYVSQRGTNQGMLV